LCVGLLDSLLDWFKIPLKAERIVRIILLCLHTSIWLQNSILTLCRWEVVEMADWPPALV